MFDFDSEIADVLEAARNSDSSILDEIPGVGPTRKKALIRAFGTVRKLRAASPAEIAQVKGVSAPVARDIAEFLSAADASESSRT